MNLEKKAAATRAGIERFLAALRDNLADIPEDDFLAAYEQIEEEEKLQRPILEQALAALRQRRADMAKLKKTAAIVKGLQLYDRQIRTIQITLASFEWGKEELEAVRDVKLVRETQEFSAGALWGDDDDY